jgi:3alpha(or 20beta)-hydroxysteroid dehydrogenase
MAGRLTTKHAVVTGAARGIGAAIARAFAAEGASVVVADVEATDGREMAETLPGDAVFRHLDVTDPADWAALADDRRDVNVLVNNAGGLITSAVLHQHDVDEWRRTLDLNLTGAFLGIRAFLPSMLERGSGVVVNMASFSGVTAQPDAAAYQAAKAGLLMLTRNAALTYAGRGIRVNAISPSVISTPALEQEHDARVGYYLDRIPMRRPGQPSEVAAAAVFLASDDARYITGVNLPVDGGYLA